MTDIRSRISDLLAARARRARPSRTRRLVDADRTV